jgi:hypothetical protein
MALEIQMAETKPSAYDVADCSDSVQEMLDLSECVMEQIGDNFKIWQL